MAYKSKTLRKLQPETRKIARLINELDSVTTRLKNLLPKVAELELDSRALTNMNKYIKEDDHQSDAELLFIESKK